jgi:hypothetical protein
MELQDYILNKDNYLQDFKEKHLYVKNYHPLNLALVKCKYNCDYDYKTYPWMRYCRGVIINTKTHRIVCIPPMKSDIITNIDEISDDSGNSYEILIDGTMINMFFHNNEWMISTRSNIGGKNSWDGKIKFNELFSEVSNNIDFKDQLQIDHCYSFVLQHNKNRIITPITNNCITLVEEYDINNLETVEHTELRNTFPLPRMEYDYLQNYKNTLPYMIKGFTVKQKNMRYKWINPNYEYVKSLKMNHNHKFMNYISLRQNNCLKEFLYYFPEESYLFNEYRETFNKIKQLLFQSYMNHFVKKTIMVKDIEYPLRPLIFELHTIYKTTGKKTTINVVSDYLHELPEKRMLFIYNYLCK